jgi:alkylated DNA nucleotide flippase Atl1
MQERPDFFTRVLEVVERIPHGRVTTYGHIAGYLGLRSGARSVGWALHGADAPAYPCHRVVNRFGALSGARHFPGPDVMEERLRSEGVRFTDEGCVDLSRHLWDPSVELAAPRERSQKRASGEEPDLLPESRK